MTNSCRDLLLALFPPHELFTYQIWLIQTIPSNKHYHTVSLPVQHAALHPSSSSKRKHLSSARGLNTCSTIITHNFYAIALDKHWQFLFRTAVFTDIARARCWPPDSLHGATTLSGKCQMCTSHMRHANASSHMESVPSGFTARLQLQGLMMIDSTPPGVEASEIMSCWLQPTVSTTGKHGGPQWGRQVKWHPLRSFYLWLLPFLSTEPAVQ